MTGESIEKIEEEDATVQNTARTALEDIGKHLHRLINLDSPPNQPAKFSRFVERTRALIDVFQEDPQLLDPLLNKFVPPVVAKYLHLIQLDSFYGHNSAEARSAAGLSRVLYTFCKVRGRKIIATFLDHEPRYFLPVFKALAHVSDLSAGDEPDPSSGAVSHSHIWEQHYILLLWISHLLLTPFDLATVSPVTGSEVYLDGLKFPSGLPLISVDAVRLSLGSLFSSTNRQFVAAHVITRLVLRPDMLQRGLLDLITNWAVSTLAASRDAVSIHRSVGLMMFLNGILTSGSVQNISTQIPIIFKAICETFNSESESYGTLQASATAKRFAVKIQRGVIIQLLQGRESNSEDAVRFSEHMLETQNVLEDVVDYLLRSLADRDTQVRMAGSKALARLAKKLDRDMAQEIVEAVIGSMNEDVLSTAAGKSLEAVNPVKWHGLTLTLSHMLFGRLPSPDQLPAILDALYLALDFEQKSPSGGSIGGNVRDAANYGLWSLARRYPTDELLPREALATPRLDSKISVLQKTANRLVTAACLDPIGNVRRGSSAALQELVGRHPDTILNGISLVQAVDYQAVGLRERAMTSIAAKAARLGHAYRVSLLECLPEWRGLFSPDHSSIFQAAQSIGNLLAYGPPVTIQRYLTDTMRKLKSIDIHNSEHVGAVLIAASEIIDQYVDRLSDPDAKLADTWSFACGKDSDADFLRTCPPWSFLDFCLQPLAPVLDFAQRRAGFAAGGYLCLVGAISRGIEHSQRRRRQLGEHAPRKTTRLSDKTVNAIIYALRAVDEALFERRCVFSSFSASVDVQQLGELVQALLSDADTEASISRSPAILRALAQLWAQLEGSTSETKRLQKAIVDVLARYGSLLEGIETRAVAIRSLGSIAALASLKDGSIDAYIANEVSKVCHASLNDYTVNERGDVGSILRSQALRSLFKASLQRFSRPDLASHCFLSGLRLYLEKLDKIRLDAASAFALSQSVGVLLWRPWSGLSAEHDLVDVSCYDHFYAAARFLSDNHWTSLSHETITAITTAVLEGFASSAGSGTSTVLPVARAALADVLAALPAFPAQSPTALHTNGTLSTVAATLSELLASHQHTDRMIVPLLEMLAFLLDMQVMQRLEVTPEGTSPFKWRTLLAYVQRAHYKTSSMPKLLAAVAVYRGLANVSSLRRDVLFKLAGMLSHPFPIVRGAVAEALWIATDDASLLNRAWTGRIEPNQAFARTLRDRVQRGEYDVQRTLR